MIEYVVALYLTASTCAATPGCHVIQPGDGWPRGRLHRTQIGASKTTAYSHLERCLEAPTSRACRS